MEGGKERVGKGGQNIESTVTVTQKEEGRGEDRERRNGDHFVGEKKKPIAAFAVLRQPLLVFLSECVRPISRISGAQVVYRVCRRNSLLSLSDSKRREIFSRKRMEIGGWLCVHNSQTGKTASCMPSPY